MSQIKVTLQNKTGDELLPKTSGEQVFLAGGTSVSAKIAALETAFASGIKVQGTVGSGGTVETLPADSYEVGDMYVVKAAGTYAGQECEAGDLILCIKAYTVGGHRLEVFLDGLRCVDGTAENAQYAEVGKTGTQSTIIRWHEDIPADSDILVRVI